MNIPTITDFLLQSSTWNIEDHQLDVNAVSALHPYIQYGLEKDSYSQILGSELYGMIRSWRPPVMLMTPTDPVLIILDYGGNIDFDFYEIDWDSYLMFKDYFVGDAATKNPNWAKEGF